MTEGKPSTNSREFLRIDQVAELLDVSRDTVYRHVRTGDLPGTRLGRLWLISRRSLEEWVGSRENRKAPISMGLPEAMEQAARMVDPGEVDELMQATFSARTDTDLRGSAEVFP